MNDPSVRLRSALAAEFELEPERLVPAARLVEDLGFDSLDLVDLVALLQRELGRPCDESELRRLRTIAEVEDFVARESAKPG